MINKVKCFGNDIYLPACDDFIQSSIVKTGGWEQKIHESYSKILNKDSIVVEVGAHVGTHTVAMAKQCQHVYSFEIQRFLHQLQCFNLINNGCYNVTTFFEGVCNYNSTKRVEELDYSRDAFNTGSLSLDSLRRPWGYPILVMGLNDKLNFLKRLDLLKIDAEGVETEVIAGGLNIINRFKPKIMVEFDGPTDKEAMQKLLPDYKWEDVIDNYNGIDNKMMLGTYESST